MSVYYIGHEYAEKLKSIGYPERPKKPRREDFSSHEKYGKALDGYENGLRAFNQALTLYRQKQSEVEQEFIEALGKELGIGNHPKYSRLYTIAYDLGHSLGLTEVAQYAETLAELLKD